MLQRVAGSGGYDAADDQLRHILDDVIQHVHVIQLVDFHERELARVAGAHNRHHRQGQNGDSTTGSDGPAGRPAPDPGRHE